VIPASFHSDFSSTSVPELSPREMNVVWAAASAFSESSTSRPLIFAGSEGGPTTMKSLCMTKSRRSPLPAFMKSASSEGACTSTTSASPRAPMAKAAPVPTAEVLT